jgi:outer membrane PBP1 activator LpoA protein
MQPVWAAGTPRASRRRGAATLLALALLAACAPRSKPPVAPPPPPPIEKPAEVKPGDVHRIAILVPLTGPNAPVGISLANAATLALVDSKKQGIRLTSYDTAALGAGGAAGRALADGAQLILGPLLAADVAAVRAAATPRGLTVLSFSNDSSVAGGPVHVLGFQPAQSVTRVVEFAASRGMKRFAGLVPDGIYGQRSSVAFTRAVAAEGGQVVALTSFQRTPTALPAAARKVTAYDSRVQQTAPARRPDGSIAPATKSVAPAAFEALLIADSGAVAAGFAPHLAKYGAPSGSFLLMGTELWNTEPGLFRSTSLRGAVFAAVPDQRFQAMATRYRARFGGTPSRLASLAYDATLLAASNAGGPWKLGTTFPAQLLADPQGFAGIDGIFRFKGNIAERGLAVQQLGPSGFTTVSPAPTAF